MNEIRDLIVGIDFGKEYSQICYYDRKGDEARSLSMKAGGNQYEAPCILCWRPEQKDYCVGLEADYFVREKGGNSDYEFTSQLTCFCKTFFINAAILKNQLHDTGTVS